MPQLVVTGDDRLMVMKHLERLGIDGFAHAVERSTRPLFDRLIDGVIQRYPNKSAKLHSQRRRLNPTSEQAKRS